ncbi:hypothetical protein FB567DRAFT_590340 [Paraphoma chrysanthemicola]|uniref:Uncharacterized protein n=1 Tax=Paraphoma chrysanthemicola TaxID=798071 RepID=A0A8K0W0N9_9PLEO|nr:hypothetical protein FB567DRAFT_590340 [Paraphoma chrysanthemicola]
MTTEDIAPEKRVAPEANTGINSLIAAANKNDRLHLLEDDVLPADLDNFIHPIFCWFECDGPLQQMLRLASNFLEHDTVLEFFVPLLYGCESTNDDSKAKRAHLSDPLATAKPAKRRILIEGVRQALHCLAHSIEFCFMEPEKRVYARTLTNYSTPVHASNCCSIFQKRLTAKIEIADRFLHFYETEDGYATSSRCAQFRHDFLFASTLVHEIIHAVGVMRRGNLIEPCIRADHPDTEWGYAWEHFMFGCVINPQDRTKPGTHLLMRKIWGDPKKADKAGGKEYSDVSMSYVAQWFRKETWAMVASKGPSAIEMPFAHFKIQSSQKYGAWIVSSDSHAIRQDVAALFHQWEQSGRKVVATGLPATTCSRLILRHLDSRALQNSNIPTPSRTYRDQPCTPLSRVIVSNGGPSATALATIQKPAPHAQAATDKKKTRKRRTESDAVEDSTQVRKIAKR